MVVLARWSKWLPHALIFYDSINQEPNLCLKKHPNAMASRAVCGNVTVCEWWKSEHHLSNVQQYQMLAQPKSQCYF